MKHKARNRQGLTFGQWCFRRYRKTISKRESDGSWSLEWCGARTRWRRCLRVAP